MCVTYSSYRTLIHDGVLPGWLASVAPSCYRIHMNANDTLPFFVYGSLRPGFHNYHLFERFDHEVVDATFSGGGTMYANGGGFPYLVHSDNTAPIVGTLVTISDERFYPYAKRTIDGLEGYHEEMPLTSHYIRTRVTVQDAEGNDVEAWTYFAAKDIGRMVTDDCPVVESGDWAIWKEAYDEWARQQREIRAALNKEALPFFVYGSLRPGFGNYRLFQRFDHETVDATFSGGATMYALSGAFPYMVKSDSVAPITGDLVSIDNLSDYPSALATIDALEGYDANKPDTSHYIRTRVTVQDIDGNDIEAWTYFASPSHAEDIVSRLPIVESGDWAQWKPAYDEMALNRAAFLAALEERTIESTPVVAEESDADRRAAFTARVAEQYAASGEDFDPEDPDGDSDHYDGRLSVDHYGCPDECEDVDPLYADYDGNGNIIFTYHCESVDSEVLDAVYAEIIGEKYDGAEYDGAEYDDVDDDAMDTAIIDQAFADGK